MSKTPLSADYIHKLLKTIPEAERSKFLEMLVSQPIVEQTPASSSAATPALDPPPQQAATATQTLDEFCDTVAQEAYAPPATASPAAPPPQKSTSSTRAARQSSGCDRQARCPGRFQSPSATEATSTQAFRHTSCRPGTNRPAHSHNKAPPPPLVLDDADTGPASTPPAQGATQPERAPTLAADAPASRVGSIINDGAGNPSLCLVQLWACRKKCGSCENAFCQATFPDRSNSFHTVHRCRDCKRAEGRNRATQPAPASSDEGWHHSNWEWNTEWHSNAWTPAWGSNEGWQEGWHHGWHQ